MSTAPSRISRALRLARWLAKTPWPIFALDILRSNIVGAVFVFGFLRFALPVDDSVQLQSIGGVNLVLFVGYLTLASVIGTAVGLYMTMPVLRWHRRSAPHDPRISKRALSLPLRMALLQAALWFVGGCIFVFVNFDHSRRVSVVIALTVLLGAGTTCALSYMQTERVLRPITVAALAQEPQGTKGLSVTTRIMLSWVLGTAMPIIGIIMVVLIEHFGIIDTTDTAVVNPVLLLCLVALAAGALGTIRVSSAIGDPIKELFRAQRRVRDGDFGASVKIYDSSELGLLQAGFNDMVHDLAERQRMRDMFGRYVGQDVARQALEHGTQLGGEIREVSVLFVDLVGSTRIAVSEEPAAVVELLNDFFKVVVDTVDLHGGFVNKFQGDAALAIFGAPLHHPDSAGAALAAARDMRGQLRDVLGGTGFGIGVSAGTVVAGHIGAKARFEYTVIGDPVNEAARITELAKNEPSCLLAAGRAVAASTQAERDLWVLGERVELRGRGELTQLARPRFAE
ncbi:adenylate/guanylate cyclase domain-containing protein [Tsukamurella sp. 8F]|uniref:adenylate/guanylate cyclase domain-containing protein n=1 Tax=unclassified Tsukamurella TaxID=2633480 RepID=UPI0023B89794|nr:MULTISPECIES: adenylate/guanylate cyclase domain-containing protein [unclassified Tsukamurella]MDF0529570.1 adenylate/guanylate cyclase domain-containing protein [Tsukamurella sp. 8J]MDF0585742.1 adenylate/guanylate cyclase domain-containing protein [Tsukamurella sp. 8F]